MLFLGRYALRCDAVISLVDVCRTVVLLCGPVAVRRRVVLACGCCRLYSWFGLPMESRGEGLPKRETVAVFLVFFGWGPQGNWGRGAAQGQLSSQCEHCAPTTIEVLREP